VRPAVREAMQGDAYPVQVSGLQRGDQILLDERSVGYHVEPVSLPVEPDRGRLPFVAGDEVERQVDVAAHFVIPEQVVLGNDKFDALVRDLYDIGKHGIVDVLRRAREKPRVVVGKTGFQRERVYRIVVKLGVHGQEAITQSPRPQGSRIAYHARGTRAVREHADRFHLPLIRAWSSIVREIEI